MPKCTKKFRDKVLALDGWRCANPFCEHPIESFNWKGWNPFIHWLSAHSLVPPRHVDVNEAITLCAYCHDKAENGFYEITTTYSTGAIPVKADRIKMKQSRITAREYEIRILEWYRDNRPDKFRWGPVLKLMYQKRKVAF